MRSRFACARAAFRHTAASLAIAAGATVKGVQAMLGHASATLTLDRYGHLFADELDAVADRIDAPRALPRTFRGLTADRGVELAASAAQKRSDLRLCRRPRQDSNLRRTV